MFRNYFVIAVRNLLKNKIYSIINVSGLTIGITCALCIHLYIKNELSYDRYHPKSDRIFRVIQEGKGEHSASLPFPTGPTIQHDYPEFVESFVRLFNWQASTLSVMYADGSERKLFNEQRFFFADSTFFKIFQFQFIDGDPATALNGPNLVVITRSTADRYFGKSNPMGKVIRFEGKQDLTISGVIQDVPDNSHFKFDFMASFRSLDEQFITQFGKIPDNWYWNPVWTYLLLRQTEDKDALQKQMPFLVKKYYHPSLRDQTDLTLQPITDIYLKSSSEYEISTMSDIRYVYIFTFIGIAILFVAIVNFINLTTARSAERFKEIGVRKVMGAHRSSLIKQFITESMVVTIVASFLAAVITFFMIPALEKFTEKKLPLFAVIDVQFLLFFLVIVFMVGIMSGSYPAFVLSSQEAVKVLKSNTGRFSQSAFLRKGLVVFQFVISIILVSGMIIAYRQVDFMQKAKLGFEGEQIIVIPMQRTSLVPKFESFKDVLLTNSSIGQVTGCHAIVGRDYQTNNYKKQGADDMATFPLLMVRNDFLKTMGVRLLAGHDFEKEFTDPGFTAIINRTMAESMGWKEPNDALGQVLDAAMEGKVTIVGVCEDFNYASLKQTIGPLIIVEAKRKLADFFTNFLLIRVMPQNITRTISYIRNQWKDFVTESPFEYFFLDEKLDQIYRAEEKLNKIIAIFSLFAIGIGAMGLFGLAAFSVQKRKKEISIRKITGASVGSIFTLLILEFLWLILIAGAIGIPLGWYITNLWLKGFAYRVHVVGIEFALSIGTILFIAFVTIGHQVFRAATLSPVESLRSE